MGDYGMSEVHQDLLTDNRTFLLRNIFPSEEFWSLLLEKKLLTSAMLEDIQVGAHSRHTVLGRITFLFWWTLACQHIVLTQLRSTEINYKHTSDTHFQGITDNIYDLFTFLALIPL